jgi:hypothetical protein
MGYGLFSNAGMEICKAAIELKIINRAQVSLTSLLLSLQLSVPL